MIKHRVAGGLALVSCALLVPAGLAQSVPSGYPTSYAGVIDAAKKEGKLVIYSSTDQASAQPLIDDFRKVYPFVTLEYNDIGTSQLYSRFQAEVAAGTPTGDLLWSSAMDLQVKLAADGYALTYASPESKNFAAENSYQNQAFGTTLEPAALIYNKRLVKAGDLPATHAAFAAALSSGRLTGKVATWDPEKSGVGFTLMEYDNQSGKDFGAVSLGLGKAQAGLYSSTGAMLEKVVSGEALYGYNIIGSYALLRQKTVPDLGIKFWKDGTIAFQRVALINKAARAPNSAKLFLDYLLSRRGQLVMANQSLIYSLRSDVAGKATRAVLTQQVGGPANLKVIAVDKRLLENLVPATRSAFLNLWRKNVKGQ
jgi:iron(III) transport system substrate-binding protein